ncbi:hypothetical protein VB716_07955 [Synechococcus sp. CCY9201]|uniref:hypothetical protein n=1 Tax=Synechococcus sp. CCY9201 TaxID=174697 RepID=UPI002B1FF253|nr:hypothetical protein [Synechococcus sp. CCY9201]MEA5474154.1 hypothetical protein [Synechococcus sp. CCY9201]
MTGVIRSPLARRLWQYQRERFPLLKHGPLILVFSGAAVGYGAALQARAASVPALLAGSVVALLLFLQMRIADEFKDLDDDRRWRPYRAVPRGLVSLRELAGVGVVAAAVQLALVLAIAPTALGALAVLWGYLLLMCAEFGCRRWLKAHLVVYVLSHMVIVPLLALLLIGLQSGAVQGGALPPVPLLLYLITAYLAGLVIELGRKIRAPIAEEPGVETWSALWGLRPALTLWWCCLLASGGAALLAAMAVGGGVMEIQAGALVALVLVPLLVVLWLRLRRLPALLEGAAEGGAEPLALATALWILALYLSLGWPGWLVGRG